MDNGEVLQGLDTEWEFMGARGVEWIVGFVAFMFVQLFASSMASAMPFMLLAWVGTTVSVAGLRKTFPDEHRGIRNVVLTACGFSPPGIPAPAALQPVWSACPLRALDKSSRFTQLGLEELFPSFQRDLTEPEV